jgi:hypothetical protein
MTLTQENDVPTQAESEAKIRPEGMPELEPVPGFEDETESKTEPELQPELQLQAEAGTHSQDYIEAYDYMSNQVYNNDNPLNKTLLNRWVRRYHDQLCNCGCNPADNTGYVPGIRVTIG